MENLQLLLAGGKTNTTDLTIFLSDSERALFVYLGLALMERVDADPNRFAYKMLVGRLVNAGIKLTELQRKFNHDPRTMKRWAEALTSTDPDKIVRAFTGRGSLPKVIGPMVRMVKLRYLQLRKAVRNYRQIIAGEVEECFGVTVSRETLRQLFLVTRKEEAAADENEAQKCPCPVPLRASAGNPMVENVSLNSAQLMSTTCLSQSDPCLNEVINDNHSPISMPSDSSAEDNTSGDLPSRPLSIDSEHKINSRTKVESEHIRTDKGGNSLSSGGQLPPIRPCKGLPYSGQPVSGQLRAIHHAGQILFSPWLDLVGAQRPQALGLQSQWIGQILQGAVNIEQSHLICDTSLSFFTGPVLAGLEAQRTHLTEMAIPETVLDIYCANVRLLPDGPGMEKIFYYDPHTKECSTLVDMLKGWCGRRHGIAKVLHLDFIHTQSGLPCFLQHYDNYYDLRERFFITLSMFGRLFPHGSPAGSTFILDRGIFGREVFGKFRQHDCDVITWEKGYEHDGWDANQAAVMFQRFRQRNDADDLKRYKFECQENPWHKDLSIRRIVVRATNPNGRMIEVSILCTNSDMDIQQIVTLIFNRWIQENNFKYLDKHFGLMQITSYAIENYKDIAHTLVDRWVDSPDYKELKRQFTDTEQALAKLLLKRERISRKLEDTQNQQQIVNQSLVSIEKHIDELVEKLKQPKKSVKLNRLRNWIRELRTKHRSLKTQTAKLEKTRCTIEEEIEKKNRTLARLDTDLDRILRKKSRLEILIEGNHQRPDIRKKAMMDAIRLTAHNIFQNMMRLFRPSYDNYRNDHVMLRMLTRTDGFIWAIDQVIYIRLWLAGRYQPHQIKKFQTFIQQMNTFINGHFDGRAATVNIDIVDSTKELSELIRNHGVHPVISKL